MQALHTSRPPACGCEGRTPFVQPASLEGAKAEKAAEEANQRSQRLAEPRWHVCAEAKQRRQRLTP